MPYVYKTYSSFLSDGKNDAEKALIKFLSALSHLQYFGPQSERRGFPTAK